MLFNYFSSLKHINTQMASSSSYKSKRAAFPVKTTNFFKVVLDEALQDGRLEIEGYVAVKFKNCVADKLLLKVPNGEVWPVDLTRDDDSYSLWLEKGWLEFANFYSLENGCFLFFSYDGLHSCFKVRIFNKNGLEVDYQFKSSRAYGEAFSRASRFQSNCPFLAVKLQSSYIANPVKIQDTFVNQYIFHGYLTRSVNLQIPNGGTWSAKCTVSICGKYNHARIHGGWTKFARDNCLQEGDAIVLELIEQQPKVTFNVHIFRA